VKGNGCITLPELFSHPFVRPDDQSHKYTVRYVWKHPIGDKSLENHCVI